MTALAQSTLEKAAAVVYDRHFPKGTQQSAPADLARHAPHWTN